MVEFSNERIFMTTDEKNDALSGLTKQRDNLLKIMDDARAKRTELRLSNRERYNDFLQKIGDVSFILGAAIVPLIIVSHASHNIQHINYVLLGAVLYLLTGTLALWLKKKMIEQDADDAPFIGLEEEINAYPVIYALNKLLMDIENKKYIEEYKDVTNIKSWNAEGGTEPKAKISFWLDGLILSFVIASLLVVRAAWSHSNVVYWLIFSVIVLVLVGVGIIGYIRALNNQYKLQLKRGKLQSIRAEWQKWFDENVIGR